jgi:hypothetical protein
LRFGVDRAKETSRIHIKDHEPAPSGEDYFPATSRELAPIKELADLTNGRVEDWAGG